MKAIFKMRKSLNSSTIIDGRRLFTEQIEDISIENTIFIWH